MVQVEAQTPRPEDCAHEAARSAPLVAGERCQPPTDRDGVEPRLPEDEYHGWRLEAVGRLAGGMAHDLNNILTVILGYTEILLRRSLPEPQRVEVLEQIRQAGERAAGLTRQLLDFSRKPGLVPRVLDLNVIVRELTKMLRRLIGEDVCLRTTLDARLHRVKADPGQIEQVLMNLVINARDAMPAGGRLGIETRNVNRDADNTRQHPEARPGPHVCLSVSDTGCGMSEAVKQRIFEPFFTTKGTDKGTGLGLATVLDIVRQHGGHITVDSAPDRGTTFAVYLPAVEDAVPEAGRDWVPVSLRRGSETILVAEDDDQLRPLIRNILECYGYRVLEARRGEEAVAVCRSHPDRIHLVLTDVVMPEMSGPELALRLREQRPEMRCLFMSGYPGEAVARYGVQGPDMALLQKPFSAAALAEGLRQALDG
jgi:nitrogen-specific signal transduction histidine kinase/CheY-like chemotaxis protein